ncbi:MAG TPA: pyridoxamine 5'-phosphate oxidase family protein [Verrucomicrobiae bacterium]|nr:pyridoxamine 5'-phosphate oxidase family protein [Verrucomicrobiae bacterium]
MDKSLKERIAYVKQMLATGRHAAMATVNADGSPHNSPFYLITDDNLQHLYFGSHPQSMHVQNVLRTGQLFVVMYDLMRGGGLYIQADHGHQLEGDELVQALAAHNKRNQRNNKPIIDLSYYQEDANPQRMYGADITKMWVNWAQRDADGLIVRDYRHEVSAKELTGDHA